MRTVLAGALGFAILAACSKPNAYAVPQEARDLFASRCAACHGAAGRGDGAAAASLTPKPRNYTDATWQKSVTDEQLRRIIVEGGLAVGKSAGMPPNPDLTARPEMLEGLVGIVRSFAR
jgi:mono/diheme cytochrome c family protein